jgi:lysine 6-dehydrogenase
MKLTVIGAGAIGTAVAYYLSQEQEVEQLQVCDAGARSLQLIHQRINNSKLRSFQVDARDPNVLEPILAGSACVISCAPPAINPRLAELCLSLGSHFVDLGGNDKIVEEELRLNERAREKSIWIVPNCGLAPGLSNILCLYAIEQFDEVTAAFIRVGDVPLYPEPPFNFRISWSADKVLDDYTLPAKGISNGEVQEYAALTEDEPIHFPSPFLNMEAFSTAGSLSTLIDSLNGKVHTLNHKSIRWPGHADQMRFLLGLGFGEKQTIDVRTHLTYRDLLVRRMRQRLGGEYEDAVLLRVVVQGRKEGRDATLVYQMIDRYNEEEKLTAMMRSTAMPTAVVAYLIATGRVQGGGAAPPECVIPKAEFCRILTERGLHITSQWYDDYRDVTNPDREILGIS